MTKLSPELLCDVLDQVCATPIYTAADDEGYRFVWCEVEDWLHAHLKQGAEVWGYLGNQGGRGKRCTSPAPALASMLDLQNAEHAERTGLPEKKKEKPFQT